MDAGLKLTRMYLRCPLRPVIDRYTGEKTKTAETVIIPTLVKPLLVDEWYPCN